jgi:hypothetical protein
MRPKAMIPNTMKMVQSMDVDYPWTRMVNRANFAVSVTPIP